MNSEIKLMNKKNNNLPKEIEIIKITKQGV